MKASPEQGGGDKAKVQVVIKLSAWRLCIISAPFLFNGDVAVRESYTVAILATEHNLVFGSYKLRSLGTYLHRERFS